MAKRPRMRKQPPGRWPLERLKLEDLALIEAAWIPPRTPHPTALRSIMTLEDYRQAWEENREEFLKLCEEPPEFHCSHRACSKPGERPRAWYMFDAPAERRRIPGHEYQAPEGTMLPPNEDEWHYEPELEYLTRHGLLGAKERRLLERRQEQPPEPARVVRFGALWDDEDEDGPEDVA